jgi:hypothetical protein
MPPEIDAEKIQEEPVWHADGQLAVAQLHAHICAKPKLETFFSDPVSQRGAKS